MKNGISAVVIKHNERIAGKQCYEVWTEHVDGLIYFAESAKEAAHKFENEFCTKLNWREESDTWYRA